MWNLEEHIQSAVSQNVLPDLMSLLMALSSIFTHHLHCGGHTCLCIPLQFWVGNPSVMFICAFKLYVSIL